MSFHVLRSCAGVVYGSELHRPRPVPLDDVFVEVGDSVAFIGQVDGETWQHGVVVSFNGYGTARVHAGSRRGWWMTPSSLYLVDWFR